MSFFGFDATLPRDRGHNTAAPGFAQAADPFAGLSRPENDDDDALDFEDTYDGLGDQLEETGDDLNDDTFGGGGDEAFSSAPKPVGKDFDFFGQTAKVADSITEEQLRFNRGQPTVQRAPQVPTGYTSQPYQTREPQQTNLSYASNSAPKAARTGYERYNQPGYIPELQADASIWGVAPKKSPIRPDSTSQPQTTAPIAGGRKMMSLEEVEAAMRAQSKKPAQPPKQPTPPAQQPIQPQSQDQHYQVPPQQYQFQQQQYSMPSRTHEHTQPLVDETPVNLQPQPPVQILQRPHQSQSTRRISPPHIQQQAQQHLQQYPGQQHPGQHHPGQQHPGQHYPGQQPVHILQNPNRLSGPLHGPAHGYPHGPAGHRIITHPNQMTEEEREAYMAEEAKRARRNHKIFLLSKDNGLMTPQDKNFITRIQLQQLVTATGNPNEHGTDAALSEDFYYQVHNQIRGGPRQHPGQPLSNFAQTYLFQTGGRHGNTRRQNRGGDNHMQRMEQQVQRAVEAAKNKPKNKQLVIEGSLGKISFSNSKTPKPLLNIKRTDSGTDDRAHEKHKVQQAGGSSNDRKAILGSIEAVYNTLMKLEDHDRLMPPPQTDDINPELAGRHQDWVARAKKLNERLWNELKVHEPIGASAVHPFIAFLSFVKGVKAIPRVFRHLVGDQRTTILTMVIVQLEQMTVIRDAQLLSGDSPNSTGMIDFVLRFIDHVLPPLLATIEELPWATNTALFELLITRNDIRTIAHSRIGSSFLTMMISRIEIAKNKGEVSDADWEQWLSVYQSFMPLIEPHLHNMFPGSVARGEDIYVWNFLAAISVGASPEQQQRIVYTVRDRVMGTVEFAKTLPPDVASKRLAVLNLFMKSIGLDVELLQ